MPRVCDWRRPWVASTYPLPSSSTNTPRPYHPQNTIIKTRWWGYALQLCLVTFSVLSRVSWRAEAVCWRLSSPGALLTPSGHAERAEFLSILRSLWFCNFSVSSPLVFSLHFLLPPFISFLSCSSVNWPLLYLISFSDCFHCFFASFFFFFKFHLVSPSLLENLTSFLTSLLFSSYIFPPRFTFVFRAVPIVCKIESCEKGCGNS